MAGDLSTLRETLSSAVGALSGWRVSTVAPDLFGQDTDHLQHHAYALRLPTTTGTGTERQRPSERWAAATIVEVLWAHRIRGDAQVADYDAGLDAEQDVVKALKGVSSAQMLVEQLDRRVVPEGWMLGTIRLRLLHHYALA